MSATANQPSSTRTPPFERILCLTGLTREGAEAVRQAAVLAGPGATIDLVSVAPHRPPGMPRPQAEQIESLVIGDRLASERAVESRPHIAEAPDEPTGVLASIQGHDLIVVPDGGTGLDVLLRRTDVSPDRQSTVGAHPVPRVHPHRRRRDGRGPRRCTGRRGALRPPCRSRVAGLHAGARFGPSGCAGAGHRSRGADHREAADRARRVPRPGIVDPGCSSRRRGVSRS